MKNKYIKVAKISKDKFRLIVKCFANDLSATQTANHIGINRNTVNRYYTLFRERIVSIQEKESPLSGE